MDFDQTNKPPINDLAQDDPTQTPDPNDLVTKPLEELQNKDQPQEQGPAPTINQLEEEIKEEVKDKDAIDTNTKTNLKPETPPAKQASTKADTLSKVLLVIGPVFLLASLATSALILKNTNQQKASQTYLQETNQKQNEVTDLQTAQKKYAKNAPENPTTVKAYADSSKKVELISGQVYSYDNPYFEWSGAKTNEPGSNIIGYFVAFGNSFDITQLKYVKTNHFSVNELGFNLKRGNVYKLYIQTITDGEASVGFDKNKKIPSVNLFNYHHI